MPLDELNVVFFALFVLLVLLVFLPITLLLRQYLSVGLSAMVVITAACLLAAATQNYPLPFRLFLEQLKRDFVFSAVGILPAIVLGAKIWPRDPS